MSSESPSFTAGFILNGLADTDDLGRRIAAGLAQGDVIALQGDLGTGKTTLARAILTALGVSEAMPSPTFTLVQSYETARFAVCHFDLYRIDDPAELDELGLDDALDHGAALIEWPERAGGRLPDDTLNLSLTIIDVQSRRAELSGPVRWAPVFRDFHLVR